MFEKIMNNEFKSGVKIPLADGGEVVIKKKLGEGGQGAVYLVGYNGNDYALKYYKGNPNNAFYKNIEKNIDLGAPAKQFLWPIAITKRDKKGNFGYIMDLRRSNYTEFTAILNGKAAFQSFSAMINAAIQLAYAFRQLHRKGYSYQDLNDGSFFFDVKTGDVLICDNDNVSPYDVNLGILGKMGYMAPEVVVGKSKPNDLTDNFSLSVILFMVFMGGHPLQGKLYASVPCMTSAAEKILFGTEPIFVYDPANDKNRPVASLHKNVINRWPMFPQNFREAFMHSFSRECLKEPGKRYTENVWLNKLMQLRNQLVFCSCGKETFIDLEKPANKCLWCGGLIQKPLVLKIKGQEIPLLPGHKLYLSQTSGQVDAIWDISGEVVRNKINPNIWGISNKSKANWLATMPDGKAVAVPSGKGFPIYKGVKIKFDNVDGEII